jgi:beta-glucosidase-like glycosyl hydrolase
VLAAQAGCDMLLVCHGAEAQARAIEGLIHAAEQGELDQDALDAAERRIRMFAARYCAAHHNPDPGRARAMAGLNEHRDLARLIAEKSGCA